MKSGACGGQLVDADDACLLAGVRSLRRLRPQAGSSAAICVGAVGSTIAGEAPRVWHGTAPRLPETRGSVRTTRLTRASGVYAPPARPRQVTGSAHHSWVLRSPCAREGLASAVEAPEAEGDLPDLMTKLEGPAPPLGPTRPLGSQPLSPGPGPLCPVPGSRREERQLCAATEAGWALRVLGQGLALACPWITPGFC